MPFRETVVSSSGKHSGSHISFSSKSYEDFQKKKRITENIQTVGACWHEKSWKTRIRERQIVDSYVTFEETFFFFNWFNDTCTPMDPFPLIINIRKFGKAGREKLEKRV